MKALFNKLKKAKGQSTIEYALIIAAAFVLVGILIKVAAPKFTEYLNAIFNKLMSFL